MGDTKKKQCLHVQSIVPDMDAETLIQKINLGEDEDIEFKTANGGFPKDVWETLSAFANTDGGYIILGVSQNKDRFEVSGIRNPNVILKTFWDSHNNEQKLSTPICSNSHVDNLSRKPSLTTRWSRHARELGGDEKDTSHR